VDILAAFTLHRAVVVFGCFKPSSERNSTAQTHKNGDNITSPTLRAVRGNKRRRRRRTEIHDQNTSNSEGSRQWYSQPLRNMMHLQMVK